MKPKNVLALLYKMALTLNLWASCSTEVKDNAGDERAKLCELTRVDGANPLQEMSMTPICSNVYAERGLGAEEHRTLKRAYKTAQDRMVDVFGELRHASVLVLFCHSPSCKIEFGAPPHAAASNDLGFSRDEIYTDGGVINGPVVVVSAPVKNTDRILIHEWVHAEMKAYAPYDATPTWFNEGMATLIAQEPNCDAHPPASLFDVTQLKTKQRWQTHIQTPGVILQTYCQSKYQVEVWALQFSDTPSFVDEVKTRMVEVGRGADFFYGL